MRNINSWGPRQYEGERRDFMNLDREEEKEGWGEFMNREQVSEERV